MKNKKLSLILQCWLSGGAMGMCLLFPGIGPLIFILGVPALTIIWKQSDQRAMLKMCAAFSVGFCMSAYLPAFSVRPAVADNLIFWLDLLVYIVVSLIHGMIFTVGLWLGFRVSCPRGGRWAYVAFLWIFAEWLIGAGPFAWPTARVSLSLWKYPALIQSAKLGGQLLVSFLIIAVNALLAEAICKRKSRYALVPLASALVLMFGNLLMGIIPVSHTEANTKIAVIQPGLIAVRGERDGVYETALKLTSEAVKEDMDIILLSESIIPSKLVKDSELRAKWSWLAKSAEADLLVGSALDGHSAVWHFSSDGILQEPYQKNREVPFFENGLGKREFRWLPENKAGIMSLEMGQTGVMICYESMFSPMARYAANEGAQMLMVLTNDSWFDSDTAKNLHMAHNVYRAVETGRPLVQAGLNGHTAAVDIYGNITDTLPHAKSGILYAQISSVAEDTPYLIWGNGWMLFIFAIAFCGATKSNLKVSVD